MRIRQRALIRLLSDDLSIDAMSEMIGTSPTSSAEKGSAQIGPPIQPRLNQWFLESGPADEAPLNHHLAHLWPVLEGSAEGLRSFTARSNSYGSLRINRHFDDTDDPEAATGPRFDRISRHPTLGFDLIASQLILLGSIGFDVAIDEAT